MINFKHWENLNRHMHPHHPHPHTYTQTHHTFIHENEIMLKNPLVV